MNKLHSTAPRFLLALALLALLGAWGMARAEPVAAGITPTPTPTITPTPTATPTATPVPPTPPPPPPPTPTSTPEPLLPETGVRSPAWPLALGLGGLALGSLAGAVLLRQRNRRAPH